MIKRSVLFTIILSSLINSVLAAEFVTKGPYRSPVRSNIIWILTIIIVVLATFFIIYKILKSGQKKRRKG